jgi:sulfur carrier protein
MLQGRGSKPDERGRSRIDMKVVLRNPRRELDVPAPRTVAQLLTRLEVVPESVLVIRNDTLVTGDERLQDDDVVEIRPVMSGGAT